VIMDWLFLRNEGKFVTLQKGNSLPCSAGYALTSRRIPSSKVEPAAVSSAPQRSVRQAKGPVGSGCGPTRPRQTWPAV